MDEQAKIILYKQLMKFEIMSNFKDKELISWEDYKNLDKKDALEYASDYRDKCSEVFNRRAKKSERRPLYLELPEMDFEGEDLKDFYLHDFMPGYAKERKSFYYNKNKPKKYKMCYKHGNNKTYNHFIRPEKL